MFSAGIFDLSYSEFHFITWRYRAVAEQCRSPSYSSPTNSSPAHVAKFYPFAPQADASWTLLKSEEVPEEGVQVGLRSCHMVLRD